MVLARLISLGHLEHVGTLKAGPGQFEKDLEDKFPMGALLGHHLLSYR